MGRYYLDTSFLIAFLLVDHESHNLAVATLKDLKSALENQLIISSLVIDEVWYILWEHSEEAKRSKSFSSLSFSSFTAIFREVINKLILDDNILFIDDNNTIRAISLALYASENFNLRPRDSFHYAYARMWEAQIVTFDSRLANTDLEKFELVLK